MPYKHVIGSGRALRHAVAAWRALAPDMELREVDLEAPDGYAALQVLLDGFDPAGSGGATAFVATDARFLNFHRLELMGSVRARGIPMPPLVERGAIVGEGVRILDNSWIGAGAVIQPGCRVGFNVVIGPGAIVCAGAGIGQSAWIDAGVTIGREARIGRQATIGMGVCIAHEVEVGTLCVIDRPGRIDADVAPKTFIQTSHAQPIRIFGA